MFDRIKNDILGRKYDLSIAFVSEKKSRELNKKYRKKDRATNVLSFSLRKDMGELVLCKAVIKKELKNKKNNLHRTFDEWLGFLVIHGMLHLKGQQHSSTMEKQELQYDQKYFSRHRHRILRNKSGSGRVRQGRKKS